MAGPPVWSPALDSDEDEEATVLMEALASGSFFADRFRVGAALGTGAMGRVVQAHDLVIGTDVALKVLHRERARDPETIERFRREAAILESIGHPGIVRVLAMGAAADGTPWLALELLRGMTLKERLRGGPMHPHEVVPILNTICDALAAAHIRGVVHRDLKPENVLLVAGGEPPCKILDFGLSRFTASKTLTRTGSILGTPRYMAPEQIKSARDADLRVDVFSVGVLLYEMLAGRSPYPAEDLGQLLGCVLEGRTVPLVQVRPDLPPTVSAVIERAMARDPAQRFQTAGAIAEAYASAIGVRSGRSMLASAPELRGITTYDEGAQPLVDPFGASAPAAVRPESERPAALAADVRSGELAAHPLLSTIAPGQLPAAPVSPPYVAAAAAPAPGAVDARASRPTPDPRASWPGGEPRASWPGGGAEFTRPSGKPLPKDTPPQQPRPARKARSRPWLGWALFLFAVVAVAIFAAGAALTLRMLTSGRLPLPSATMP